MENWSANDDRPPMRAEERWSPWPWLALALMVSGGALWFYAANRPPPEQKAMPAQAAAPVAKAEPAPAAAEAPHFSEAAPQPSLPTLENSDSMMRQALSGLVGGKAFESYVLPDQLVRRIVATVDNLPRPTAPRRMLPLNPVAGSFSAAGAGEEMAIDRANFARYQPYVRVLELVSVQALVRSYVNAYPLFQRAYEELGYPGRHFNDRLLEALDDLLAAPEADTAKLMRPRVLYEFADPDLETRSAGQKVLLRMGAENAAAVKAKLRDIRAQILAASRGPR